MKHIRLSRLLSIALITLLSGCTAVDQAPKPLVETTEAASSKIALANWERAQREAFGESRRKTESNMFPAWKIPANQMERVKTTPDLMQSTPAFNFPGSGNYYCAPVSMANAFIFLSKHGYGRLVPPECDQPTGQSQLGLDLGKRMVRNCDTKANDLLRATRDYVRERGYQVKSLTYEGCERVDGEFLDDHKRPNMQFIKKSLDDPNAVAIMTIGFYSYNQQTDTYYQCAQHDVTLVGYCHDSGKTASDHHVFVIHDPARRSGTQEADDFVLATPLKHGHWHWDDLPLTDLYQLSGELHKEVPANIALLEGIAVLTLKPPVGKPSS